MKHPSSRAYFAYWDAQRSGAKAPDRSAFEPSAVRELLADSFVLACQRDAGLPFRVAGTRVCALFGRDVKGEAFVSLFASPREPIANLIGVVIDELQPVVAGLSATAPDGARAQLELLLLPFNPRAYTPPSLTGLLTPLGVARGGLHDVVLTSWRILQPRRSGPRALRKVTVIPGFTVYEGLL
jgi:hypothetical protein